MIYRTKGSMVRIGIEHEVAGRKKPVLTVRENERRKVIATFTNDEAAKEFEKVFEQFIRGAVIEDRENRRKRDVIEFHGTNDVYR